MKISLLVLAVTAAVCAAAFGAVRAQARGTVRAFVRHRRRLAADPLHGIGLVVLRSLEGGGYAYGAARAALTRR